MAPLIINSPSNINYIASHMHYVIFVGKKCSSDNANNIGHGDILTNITSVFSCTRKWGGGGGTRDQISDIRPPKNQISDIGPPKKNQISDITTTIRYQISGLSPVFFWVKYSLYQLMWKRN